MKLKTILFYLNLALLSSLTFWSAKTLADQLNTFEKLSPSDQLYWLKLLHADNSKLKSKMDGDKFFLSPIGKTDPSAELEATLNAFKNPNLKVGWFNYPVQCIFRERLHFFKKLGLLKDVPLTNCPMFDEWKKGLDAKSVTLVFSSSYPNNPSSLFGHTLIRLNQKNRQNELLDYAISFSAIPEDDIGIVFAYKGLFGGYKGLLEVSKYYTKVNDYNNGESRDLIEYDLKLTEEQLDRLINHSWEMYQTTYADYFFHDENCSSVLADILSIALFEVDGINSHDHWYYLPSELVKKFTNVDGLVTDIHLRPSLKKQISARIEQLSLEDKSELKNILSHPNLLSDKTNKDILDSLIGFFDYKRYRTKGNLTEDEFTLFRKSLLARSKIKEESTLITKTDEISRPELGHGSSFISSFLRTENSHSLLGFELKTGYHHLLARDIGFDPFSQFDFLTGSLIYDKKINKLNFDKFTIVHLTSLHSFKFYDPQLSWNAEGSIDRFYQRNCDLCHRLNAKMDGGISLDLNKYDRLNFFGGIFGEAGPHYSKGFLIGPVIEASYYTTLGSNVKLGIATEERYSLKKSDGKNFQNISNIKGSYFPSLNNEYSLEFKTISKFGSLNYDTRIFNVSFGKHF